MTKQLTPQSLCILRLSAIGDVSHAVALVERIQRVSPDTKITWIIGKLEYQLVKDIANIEFIIFDKKQGKAAYRQLKTALNGRRFDALFLMQVALRANLAARMIKAKIKYGFDWQRSKELHWLFANKRIAPQKHAHVLDGFMAFADAAGFAGGNDQANTKKEDKAEQNDRNISHYQPKWHVPLLDKSKAWAQQHVAKLGKFAIISPAASKAERNWLPDRYAQVADHLHAKGYQVILCGGPAAIDRQLGDQILSHTHNIALDLIGQSNLQQLLALLEQASLVIAPDTGPAHMATMVNTPVVGLYAHSNPRRTGPYLSQEYVVSVYDEVIQAQKGKPWQQMPWGTRAKGEDLMQRISVDAVIDKINKVLASIDR